MTCTKTTIDVYENLYRLDVLGAIDIARDNTAVHQYFKDQLRRSKGCWYETGWMWKDNSTSLQNSKLGSLETLKNLLRKTQELFESYDQVIQEQLAERVVEKVNDEVHCGQREFYLPHKAVFRKNVERAMLQIVYDTSARENSKILSLNDCLETGPALQNLLWSILIKNQERNTNTNQERK